MVAAAESRNPAMATQRRAKLTLPVRRSTSSENQPPARSPSVPANTPKELVEWIARQDGGVNYASAAPGSSQHVAAELLVKRAGIKPTHVPYRGSSAAMPDLMSGRVAFMFDNLPSALPQARAGKVKALA